MSYWVHFSVENSIEMKRCASQVSLLQHVSLSGKWELCRDNRQGDKLTLENNNLTFNFTDLLWETRRFLWLVRIWRLCLPVAARAGDWIRLRAHPALLVRHCQQQGGRVSGYHSENSPREGEKMRDESASSDLTTSIQCNVITSINLFSHLSCIR